MRRQGAGQPLARLGRNDQRLEKALAIPIRQFQRLVLGYRPTNGLSQGGDAALTDLPPRQISCGLYVKQTDISGPID